jgi:hypothetical protein
MSRYSPQYRLSGVDPLAVALESGTDAFSSAARNAQERQRQRQLDDRAETQHRAWLAERGGGVGEIPTRRRAIFGEDDGEPEVLALPGQYVPEFNDFTPRAIIAPPPPRLKSPAPSPEQTVFGDMPDLDTSALHQPRYLEEPDPDYIPVGRGAYIKRPEVMAREQAQSRLAALGDELQLRGRVADQFADEDVAEKEAALEGVVDLPLRRALARGLDVPDPYGGNRTREQYLADEEEEAAIAARHREPRAWQPGSMDEEVELARRLAAIPTRRGAGSAGGDSGLSDDEETAAVNYAAQLIDHYGGPAKAATEFARLHPHRTAAGDRVLQAIRQADTEERVGRWGRLPAEGGGYRGAPAGEERSTPQKAAPSRAPAAGGPSSSAAQPRPFSATAADTALVDRMIAEGKSDADIAAALRQRRAGAQ